MQCRDGSKIIQPHTLIHAKSSTVVLYWRGNEINVGWVLQHQPSVEREDWGVLLNIICGDVQQFLKII